MLVAIALVVSIHAAPSIPRTIVVRALAEADAIWRTAGVPIEWRIDDPLRAQLRVTVADEHGESASTDTPIGWIRFLYDGAPGDDIHLSRANALALLYASENMRFRDLPPAASDVYLGRALGRALAHEIGHWMFRSRAHPRAGLMATRRTPAELFGVERGRFVLSPAERRMLAVVLQGNRLSARTASPAQ